MVGAVVAVDVLVAVEMLVGSGEDVSVGGTVSSAGEQAEQVISKAASQINRLIFIWPPKKILWNVLNSFEIAWKSILCLTNG